MPVPLLLLMLAAPAVVTITLLVFHDVFAVFVLYHLGVCLVLPAVVNLVVRRRGWRSHLAALGLAGPGTRRGLALGAGLAMLLGGAINGFLTLWSGALPTGDAMAVTLAEWGAGPERFGALVLFMCVVNGPAEELFWRGFVATELAALPSRRERLVVPSVCYASYHVATVVLLVRDTVSALIMLVAVLAAGVGWAWLRERTGSVWPAIVSHAAATGVYMAAAWPLLVP